MYINISYKFHRIPDTQSRFMAKVHDLLGQLSYINSSLKEIQKDPSQLGEICVASGVHLSGRGSRKRAKAATILANVTMCANILCLFRISVEVI